MKKTTLEDRGGSTGAFAGATAVSSGLVLDLGPPIRPGEEEASYPITAVVRIVEIEKPLKDSPYVLRLATSGSPTIVAAIPSSRAKGKEFLLALDELRAHVAPAAEEGTVLLSPGREEELEAALEQLNTPDSSPVVTLSSADDLPSASLTSAKKLILPVAVALLCSIPELGEELDEDEEVDKIVIADALHKLVALWPDGNPPRAALKRVNEFLMSERRQ